MNTGTNRICRESDTEAQVDGTRTLPSPRRMLSNIDTANVIHTPLNSTRA